jgi:hypothetical protein
VSRCAADRHPDARKLGPDSVDISAIHGCQGKYVEVTAKPPKGQPVRGWSYLPCSLQLTTCDGGVTE